MNSDGKVEFTDKIKNNPQGIRFGIAQNAFRDSFWRDDQVFLKYAYSPETVAAVEQWSIGDSKQVIRYGGDRSGNIHLTAEELKTIADMGNRYFTYIGINAFVSGTKPMEEWDDYVSAMKASGIEEETAIYQEAYDRFWAR